MIRIEQIFSFSILKTFTKAIFTTFFVLLIHQQMFAQVADNFSDGDLTSNPTWLGHTDKFVITGGQLQLVAPPLADISYLYVESHSIDQASWEFYCKLFFNPSSSNYARVYLVSDQADLSDALNGYYVMIGNTADEVSLYKQTGTTKTKIIDGGDGRLNLSAPEVRVKVTRDKSGSWKLYTDVGNTGFVEEGSVTENTHIASAYAGVLCNYTSTRSDKFFFDDFVFSGDPYIPPPPPSFKDIIVTEIFADPAPRLELPEVEFIEIYNRSNQIFSMSEWTLSDGASTAILPAAEIQPHEFIILCSSSGLVELQGYGNTVGITSFPSLNNTEDVIMLRDKDGSLIDSLHYTDRWYRDDLKKEGGWSLELIDTANICSEDDNWTASENEDGGTPGTINSVNANKPDVAGPRVVSVFAEDSITLMITFNEKLSTELPSITAFTLEPELPIQRVQFASQDLRSLRLTLKEPLQRQTYYTLSISNTSDCAGNNLDNAFSHSSFAIPESAVSGDLVVNEILFNPRPGGVDFVELVNVSDKYIDVSSLQISNSEGAQLINKQSLTNNPLLLMPGGYLVLTEDKDILKSDYTQTKEEVVLEVLTLPTLNDDDGTIGISSADGAVIDMFAYSKDFHSPFLQDDEGVSLERISISQATQDPNNWKSASTQANYATPGFLNSQSRPDTPLATGDVTVSPELFEPITGQPDFTEIHYQFTTSGYMANVKIVDPQGRVIKDVASNELLGTSGTFRWDGDTDTGAKARIGYYMVWIEIFDNAGVVTSYRKRVGVVARF